MRNVTATITHSFVLTFADDGDGDGFVDVLHTPTPGETDDEALAYVIADFDCDVWTDSNSPQDTGRQIAVYHNLRAA